MIAISRLIRYPTQSSDELAIVCFRFRLTGSQTARVLWEVDLLHCFLPKQARGSMLLEFSPRQPLRLALIIYIEQIGICINIFQLLNSIKCVRNYYSLRSQ